MNSITLESLNERVNELSKNLALLQKDLENLVTVVDDMFKAQNKFINELKEEK